MEKHDRKMASDVVLMEIIKTLFIKGGNNKAVAIRIFNIYAKFGAFSSEVLEYARGIGLLPALVKQAELEYEKFYDASVSILSHAHRWDILAQKGNWHVLAACKKWNFLAEKEQWDILAEYQQWDTIAAHKKWDVLEKYQQWNVLVENSQWDVLSKNSRWVELLSAGRFETIPRKVMIGYAFMRCFMR